MCTTLQFQKLKITNYKLQITKNYLDYRSFCNVCVVCVCVRVCPCARTTYYTVQATVLTPYVHRIAYRYQVHGTVHRYQVQCTVYSVRCKVHIQTRSCNYTLPSRIFKEIFKEFSKEFYKKEKKEKRKSKAKS